MPKISVIVPIYNKEHFLQKSISSILSQTERDIEVILVDDGSTDNSPAICQKYAKKDSRIVYKQKNNGGAASARNYGYRHACGEYIAFVDPDDYIDPDFFDQTLKNFNNADIIISGFIHEIGKKRVTQIMPEYLENFYEGEDIREIILPLFLVYGKHIEKNILLAPLFFFLFKRNFLEEEKIIGDESVTYSEDLLFSLEALFKAKSVALHRKAYYHYVHNSFGLTENYNSKLILDYVKVLQKLEAIGVFSYIPKCYSANPNLIYIFFLFAIKNLSLKKAPILSLSKELHTFFELDYFKDIGKTIKACNVPLKKRILFYLIKYKFSLPLIFMYKLKNKINLLY